jgi:hypothetical protein
MLPPDDDVEEDGYQALPDEAALRSLHQPPQPRPFAAPDEDGYGVLPASNGDLQRTGYGVLPDDDEGGNDQRFSEMTEYGHVELPNEDEIGKMQQQRSRQSVRLSLSTMAALVNGDGGLPTLTADWRASCGAGRSSGSSRRRRASVAGQRWRRRPASRARCAKRVDRSAQRSA